MLSGLTSLDVYVKENIILKGDLSTRKLLCCRRCGVAGAVVLTGRLSAKNVTMQSSSKVIYDDGQPKLQCFNDNFDSSSLKPEWVVKPVKGHFPPSKRAFAFN